MQKKQSKRPFIQNQNDASINGGHISVIQISPKNYNIDFIQ